MLGEGIRVEGGSPAAVAPRAVAEPRSGSSVGVERR